MFSELRLPNSSLVAHIYSASLAKAEIGNTTLDLDGPNQHTRWIPDFHTVQTPRIDIPLHIAFDPIRQKTRCIRK